MDWRLIVPAAKELAEVDVAAAREIRLRPGQPVTVLLPEGRWIGRHLLSPGEVTQAARALSGYGLAARQAELAAGYLPLPGGHRLGVSGVMGKAGLMEITSLCVRIAHAVEGAAETVYPRIRGQSALIFGPPGSGKTTLLRDVIRLYGQEGWQVGVADERGEIAACRDGAPQLNIGPGADVVTGLPKARALPLLVRAMAPQVVAADELGGVSDARAALDALRCGPVLLCTVHARDLGDLKKRPGLGALLQCGAAAVMLTKPGDAPRIAEA